MELCACSGSILNTGTPDNQRVIASGVKLFAVKMKADDGTLNEISSADTIDQAYLDALINNEDESKRWYPIGEFRNEEDLRADAVTESFTDGSTAITQQGVRSYTGVLVDYAPKYLEALKSFSCADLGIYSIDACGSLTGSISKDGTALRPIRVNAPSWNPTYVKQTPTVSGKVQLSFEFSQLERDSYLRKISEDEVTADLLAAEGLIPLSGAISGEATTGFVVALTVDYDIFLAAEKTKVPAWVITDFALYNKTTQAAITITTVTEAPEGTYTFVTPAQTSADVLELTNLKTTGLKPGFGLKVDVTIP
jgi:hypothetical protein